MCVRFDLLYSTSVQYFCTGMAMLLKHSICEPTVPVSYGGWSSLMGVQCDRLRCGMCAAPETNLVWVTSAADDAQACITTASSAAATSTPKHTPHTRCIPNVSPVTGYQSASQSPQRCQMISAPDSWAGRTVKCPNCFCLLGTEVPSSHEALMSNRLGINKPVRTKRQSKPQP